MRRLRSDSGGGLNAALFNQGLVDELAVLWSPCLVGRPQLSLFAQVALPRPLKLHPTVDKSLGDGYRFALYSLEKSADPSVGD